MAFAAPEKRSRYAKRVILETDDPDLEKVTITVAARVGLPLDLRVDHDEDGDPHLILVNDGEKPVKPLYAISSDPGVVARVPRDHAPAGGTLRIPLQIDEDANAARITLHTALEHQSTLTVTWRRPKDD